MGVEDTLVSFKDTNPIRSDPILMTSFNRNYLQLPLLIESHRELKLQNIHVGVTTILFLNELTQSSYSQISRKLRIFLRSLPSLPSLNYLRTLVL